MADRHDYAIRTQQEVADIMFARGLIRKPDKKIVQWLERKAFGQIRALWPELACEIEGRSEEFRTAIERVY